MEGPPEVNRPLNRWKGHYQCRDGTDHSLKIERTSFGLLSNVLLEANTQLRILPKSASRSKVLFQFWNQLARIRIIEVLKSFIIIMAFYTDEESEEKM